MTVTTEDSAQFDPRLPPDERLVGVSLAGLKTQHPAPVDLWNAKGMLLLRKGDKLDSLERQQMLSRHQPSVRESDLDAWRLATRQWAPSPRQPVNMPGPAAKKEQNLNEAWLDAHAALSVLLHQGEQVKDFVPRLLALGDKVTQWMERRPDESLFVLVQMLYDAQLGYCASNALAAAAVCHVIGPTAGLDAAQRHALTHAALTMNIAMARTQDQLAVQKSPPDAVQMQVIDAHPQAGADQLAGLGVADSLWLALVRQHHSSGNPATRPDHPMSTEALALQLLQLADRFVARISPRKSRRGQSVRAAVKALYQEMQTRACPLGQLLVQHLGIYLPGSYVLLQNDEIAVVTRSTGRINAPMVMSIVGKDGIALSAPRVRDTADPAYAIKDAIASDQVKVRLDPSRLLDPR